MGHKHAGGHSKTEDSGSKKKTGDSGDHDKSGDDGKLSQAMTRKEMWSDAKTLGFFVDCFAYLWNNPGDGDELIAKQPDSAMRDALANTFALRGYLHDGSGDMAMVQLALDTWSGSVKKTIKQALDTLGVMPDASIGRFHRGMAAYYDVIDTFAELYKRSDQKEAEEAGAGAGIKTPHKTSKKEKADVAKALEKGKELAKNARDTVVGLSGDEKFEGMAEKINKLYEIVTGPGELEEKLKDSHGALQNMQSIDEILQYALTVLETFTTTVFSLGAKFASGETAKFLGEISEGFETWLGRGAAVLQIIDSALDCIDKIREGDYKGAVDAAVGTGEGIIMLIAPESGTVFAAAAFWWFEVKGLTDATTAFLNMIDDDRKRAAVDSVVGPAQRMAPTAQSLAQNLEAWAKRVGDTSLEPDVLQREAELLKLSIDSESALIAQDLDAIHKSLETNDHFHVGGYADLLDAYEVGTYNAAPESKVNPNALGAAGWNPPAVVYNRAHFGDMPGFVRALMHGVQSLASVAGGDAREARNVRLTELTRMGDGDIEPGGIVQIGLPFNGDSDASVLEVTNVSVRSTNDAFRLRDTDYARHLKSAKFADAADQFHHPLELSFSPFGADTYQATVTVEVAFPDGHSETRSLTIKQDYGI